MIIPTIKNGRLWLNGLTMDIARMYLGKPGLSTLGSPGLLLETDDGPDGGELPFLVGPRKDNSAGWCYGFSPDHLLPEHQKWIDQAVAWESFEKPAVITPHQEIRSFQLTPKKSLCRWGHVLSNWGEPYNTTVNRETGHFGDFKSYPVIFQDRGCLRCGIVFSRYVRDGSLPRSS